MQAGISRQDRSEYLDFQYWKKQISVTKKHFCLIGGISGTGAAQAEVQASKPECSAHHQTSKEETMHTNGSSRQRRVWRIACLAILASIAMPIGISDAASKRRVVRKKVVPAFTIRVLGDAQTITAGSTATYSFALTRTGGFRKSVRFDVPDVPPGVTATITAQSTSSFQLQIATSPTTFGGSAVYVLRGTSGSLERIALFRLTVNPAPTTTLAPTASSAAPPTTLVGDFSLSADVQNRTVAPGDVAVYGIRVDRKAFAGPVAFKIEGLPNASTANAAPDPTQANSNLYVTTTTATLSGTYLIVITGSGGGLTRSIATRLIVRRTGPFVLTVAPALVTVNAGSDATTNITTGQLAGAPEPPEVTLALNNAPPGVEIRTRVTLGRTTKFVLSTSADTAAGTYKLSVVATSGTNTQTLPFTLVVTRNLPGFGISAQPVSATVLQGASTTYEIKVVPIAGFSGPVTFAVTGLPPTATSSTEATATGATVKITTTPSTPATTYPLLITGKSGSLVATVAVSLVVAAAAV